MLRSFKKKLAHASSATKETLHSASLFGTDSCYAKSSAASASTTDPIASSMARNSSATKLKFRGWRKKRQNVRPKINIAKLTTRVEHLSVFGNCMIVAPTMRLIVTAVIAL
jgi:hypothetical protein